MHHFHLHALQCAIYTISDSDIPDVINCKQIRKLQDKFRTSVKSIATAQEENAKISFSLTPITLYIPITYCCNLFALQFAFCILHKCHTSYSKPLWHLSAIENIRPRKLSHHPTLHIADTTRNVLPHFRPHLIKSRPPIVAVLTHQGCHLSLQHPKRSTKLSFSSPC